MVSENQVRNYRRGINLISFLKVFVNFLPVIIGGISFLVIYLIYGRRYIAKIKSDAQTEGTVIGYSILQYNNAVNLPKVEYTVQGKKYHTYGPRYFILTKTRKLPWNNNETNYLVKGKKLYINRNMNSVVGVSINPLSNLYPIGTKLPVHYWSKKPKRAYVLFPESLKTVYFAFGSSLLIIFYGIYHLYKIYYLM